MKLAQLIRERGIADVLHFTTSNGLLGILDSRAILPRARLASESRLEYIVQPNCSIRKDPQWTGHVSLSITRVNARFFEFSRSVHGADTSWAVLSLDPRILTHAGVVFCTGNNTWPRARRAHGHDGLHDMFSAVVPGTYQDNITRPADLAENHPTSDQAEVLYPDCILLEHVQRVFFSDVEHADLFLAQARALNVIIDDSLAAVAPERFK